MYCSPGWKKFLDEISLWQPCSIKREMKLLYRYKDDIKWNGESTDTIYRYRKVWKRKSTSCNSYWILFEYIFAEVWDLRINFIFLPRSAKKENLFICTSKVLFNWSSKIKYTISLKEWVLINFFFYIRINFWSMC